MTAMTMLVTRRGASLCALIAVSAAFLLCGVASAGSTYPAPVSKAFMKACTKAGVDGSSFSKSKVTAYCAAALKCVESKMTLSQFVKSKANDRVIAGCETSAAKQVFT
jgi:hypothetical protein